MFEFFEHMFRYFFQKRLWKLKYGLPQLAKCFFMKSEKDLSLLPPLNFSKLYTQTHVIQKPWKMGELFGKLIHRGPGESLQQGVRQIPCQLVLATGGTNESGSKNISDAARHPLLP